MVVMVVMVHVRSTADGNYGPIMHDRVYLARYVRGFKNLSFR